MVAYAWHADGRGGQTLLSSDGGPLDMSTLRQGAYYPFQYDPASGGYVLLSAGNRHERRAAFAKGKPVSDRMALNGEA